MATSGKAIFFNALVVIGGFLIFLTSNFRVNFYLGAMLSLSMAACLIVSMTVLPAILNRFKPRFVYGEEKAAVMTTRSEQVLEMLLAPRHDLRSDQSSRRRGEQLALGYWGC